MQRGNAFADVLRIRQIAGGQTIYVGDMHKDIRTIRQTELREVGLTFRLATKMRCTTGGKLRFHRLSEDQRRTCNELDVSKLK